MILLVILVLAAAYSLIPTGKAMAADSGNLSWGSRGQAVTQMQQILNDKGYSCGNGDGIFGAKTYNAVVHFQRDAGLRADGIVGPITKKALGISPVSPISSTPVSRGGPVNRGKTLTMVATGYDNGYASNYPYYGAPSYSGLPLARGIIATDPNVIPMGTRLYVEGYGEGIAADQGGAIKGNRIDLFFDSNQEAMNWGMRSIKVTIL
jgi:3D (Asp-Asp-Asp) domain-containing protein